MRRLFSERIYTLTHIIQAFKIIFPTRFKHKLHLSSQRIVIGTGSAMFFSKFLIAQCTLEGSHYCSQYTHKPNHHLPKNIYLLLHTGEHRSSNSC
ncbi:hypothetical protein [Pseudomonas sp. 28 E 9]|nr:hypothetical protein [Pseudomonas sp. 28 E 9]